MQFASVNGGVRPVTTGVHILTLDSVSKDLMAAGTVTDPDHPAEVTRWNLLVLSAIDPLTHVSAGLLSGKKLARTEEIDFNSSGNTKVQGWMVKPPDFDPAKK